MPNWILIILIRTVITDMWTLVIEVWRMVTVIYQINEMQNVR